MKKHFPKSIVLTFAGLCLLAGNAGALTLSDFSGNMADDVYDDTGASYVSLTDLNDPASAPMYLEANGFAADFQFGIYDPDGSTLPYLLPVLDTVEKRTQANLVFDVAAGTATARAYPSFLQTAAMGTTFGFYLRFYSGMELEETIYYSDGRSAGSDVFSIFHDPGGLDSALGAELGVGIVVNDEMTWISMEDTAPAPVPEPATMLLMGTGLAGLAAVSRKKMSR